MDLNNLFKLLNLDKNSRDKLIYSHPLLKEHFSNDFLRRKHKKLDSPLAKKLEDKRQRLIEQYYSLKDIYKILGIGEFDKIRKQDYIRAYKEISKIQSPKKRNYQLLQLYDKIQQDIEYFVGEEEQTSDDLPVEDQIRKNILLGSTEFEK